MLADPVVRGQEARPPVTQPELELPPPATFRKLLAASPDSTILTGASTQARRAKA